MIQRFLDKIEYAEHSDDDCWYWSSAVNKFGYGAFWLDGKTVRAHRYSYEMIKGKIPDGLQLDHLCRNRLCVNPEHLEVVSLTENIKRGLTGKINHHSSKKTHCPKGHEYTEDNIKRIKNNNRNCLTCHREWNKEYMRKKRGSIKQ